MARDISATPERPGPAEVPDHPERRRGADRPDRVDAAFGEVQEPYARRLDRPAQPGGDTPRETIRRFDPERAGLDPITHDEADRYVRDHAGDRPSLGHSQFVGPDTRRVLAAVDRGNGHALERHGSTVTPEMTENRVTRLEDPAIAENRTPGRDAFKSGTHACGDSATRIRDPHAFATCFAQGVEHPDVRASLDRPCGRGERPPPSVRVPLTDLLGPDGHQYCDGHRIEPVEGSREAAYERRAAWVGAVREGRDPDVPEPTARHLEADDFRDARVVFAFRPNTDRSAWEISTMYVDPVRRDQQ